MARKELAKLKITRCRFRARIERIGSKAAYRGPYIPTLLLTNVVIDETKKLVTDHPWFTAGKWSQAVRPGDTIAFDAPVGEYVNGYFGRREDVYIPSEVDYRLERPTKVEVVKNDAECSCSGR